MNKLVIEKSDIETLVVGGCILGGGGGGSRFEGKQFGELAFDLGEPTYITVDDLKEEDIVVTVSGVGAPAAENQYVKPADYVKTYEMLVKNSDIKPAAIMTNENGGAATINGLIQSAILGVPILDAACNGRAHPTGIMGSMGLNEVENFVSCQVGIGGKRGTENRVEVFVTGSLNSTSKAIRQAAVNAGGVVMVARNPVPVSYVKENAAVHAISHAFNVGKAFFEGTTAINRVKKVAEFLRGKIIVQGKVQEFNLETKNGFDLGSFKVLQDSKEHYLTFWNEYMSIDIDGNRVSTFPNLIMTFSLTDGYPITTAELKENDDVIVISVPYNELILGKGMYIEENYNVVEEVLNIEVKKYISDIFLKTKGE